MTSNPQGVVVISLGDLIELAGHPGVEDGLASVCTSEVCWLENKI